MRNHMYDKIIRENVQLCTSIKKNGFEEFVLSSGLIQASNWFWVIGLIQNPNLKLTFLQGTIGIFGAYH